MRKISATLNKKVITLVVIFLSVSIDKNTSRTFFIKVKIQRQFLCYEKIFLPITTEPAKLRNILKFWIFIKSSSFGYIFKFVNQKSKSTVNAIRNTIFPLQVVYIVFDMKTETMT